MTRQHLGPTRRGQAALGPDSTRPRLDTARQHLAPTRHGQAALGPDSTRPGSTWPRLDTARQHLGPDSTRQHVAPTRHGQAALGPDSSRLSSHLSPPLAFWMPAEKNASLKKSSEPAKTTRALLRAWSAAINSVSLPTACGNWNRGGKMGNREQ